MADLNEDKWLLIGRIVGAHGLDGYVKVKPESDFPERFEVAGDRWLRKKGAEPVQIRLVSGRFLEGKSQYLVKFDGVNYRDQAEDLRSAELLVEASDRLAVDPGEFHVADLIGLAVVLKSDQSTLGTITNIFTTGHDLLEVTLENQEAVALEQNKSSEKQIEEEHDSMRAKAVQKLRRQKRKNQKKKAPKTLLIPFVESIVPIVDIAAGRIEITPPPGLIDL
ncbi:MAG: ribosome maturation factor RimM [Leptolyngbya foveolarum]|uniref:Ribosome maturation factor RimM n=1 Tax=Leptolyngbya foveolarum TaxID=47253 RepID=A0A2W4U8N0_9CYAN|nr:MAG: ribosome maturation factor RimM [Leptolyngbya foveolarum]